MQRQVATQRPVGRRFLALVGSLMLVAVLASCGDEDADEASVETEPAGQAVDETEPVETDAAEDAGASDGETGGDAAAEGVGPTMEHDFGSTTMPVAPSRIVALDEAAALDLLAIGVVPMMSFAPWGSAITQDLLEDNGVEVVPVGTSGAGMEAVLAEEPDLIVMTAAGDASLYEQVNNEIPVLAVPFTFESWEDKLAWLGEAFGRSEHTDAVAGVLQARLDGMQEMLAGESISVSVLYEWGGFFASSNGDGASTPLLLSAGFDVPEPQKDKPGVPYNALSEELLAGQDADIIAIYDGGEYDFDAVTSKPGFAQLQGEEIAVNGEMWFNSAPFATFWIIRDLEVLAAGDLSALAVAADASSLFDEYENLVN
ncbi:MAG: ABC transporter substrate-binding protein [Actinomycetota bacterium]